MREILFRGKRIDNGEWEYGGYFKHNNRQKCVIGDYDKPEDFDDLIIFSGFADWNMPRPLNCVKVDPTTVGQYTGLIDKNGKKIFEGDILDCGDRVVYVKWHEGCATWDSQFICYKGQRRSNGVNNADWQFRAEVVGNIHDNPELLEGTK